MKDNFEIMCMSTIIKNTISIILNLHVYLTKTVIYIYIHNVVHRVQLINLRLTINS